jgi:hypothetical protein
MDGQVATRHESFLSKAIELVDGLFRQNISEQLDTDMMHVMGLSLIIQVFFIILQHEEIRGRQCKKSTHS